MDDHERDFWEALGAAVRETRELAELSQASLAEEVGVARTSMVNMEAGRQRFDVHRLVLIADALGVMPGEMIPEE